jgi:hypothetical protein
MSGVANPSTVLSMRQSRFSDYINGAMLIGIALLFSVMNLYEFYMTTKSFKKATNIALLAAILCTLQNTAIKVFEYSMMYPSIYV